MYAEVIATQDSYMYHGRRDGVLMLGDGHPVPYEGTRFALQEFRLDHIDYNAVK